MRDLTRMLHTGNLTAREKFILLIQNDVQKMKTGRDILTPADKDALENWKAKDNSEAREWNRLNEAWKHTGRMEIEVELIYKDAKVAYLAQLPVILNLLYYPSYRRMGRCIDTLEKMKMVELDEAVRIAAKQKEVKLKEGLDFDYAVYQLAFEKLNQDDRKRMNELYPDVETDHQYLDQEEIIANLYNGKSEFSPEAKEKLASLVAEQSYNKFAKEYQLFHYFACIPLVEVARYFLKMKGIEVTGKAMAKNQEADDEDTGTCDDVTKAMEKYAVEHNTTIQVMLKEGCLKWLDNGLEEAYTPLAVSSDADLFNRWLAIKTEANSILRKHIEASELQIRNHTDAETLKEKLYSKRLYDSEFAATKEVMERVGLDMKEKGELDEKKAFEKLDGAVITGESLYNFNGNYEFVKDFKERTDRYDANLGIVYADDDPEHKGDHLDRELIIGNLNNQGKPNFFSIYNMSLTILSGVFEGKILFKEFREDGKTFLKFNDASMEKIFRERREMLIDGYSKLLAFEGLLKKLFRTYETDLTGHVSERKEMVKLDIDQYNEAIRVATNTNSHKKKGWGGIFQSNEVLYFKDDPIINLDSIKPDAKAISEHEEKLLKILGTF